VKEREGTLVGAHNAMEMYSMHMLKVTENEETREKTVLICMLLIRLAEPLGWADGSKQC
jgi:hypothetical protein